MSYTVGVSKYSSTNNIYSVLVLEPVTIFSVNVSVLVGDFTTDVPKKCLKTHYNFKNERRAKLYVLSIK